MRSKMRCCACQLRIAHAVAFLEIAAGAEDPLAGASQYHCTAIVGMGEELGKYLQEIDTHLRFHCIGGRRPGERHQQHLVGGSLDSDGFEHVRYEMTCPTSIRIRHPSCSPTVARRPADRERPLA